MTSGGGRKTFLEKGFLPPPHPLPHFKKLETRGVLMKMVFRFGGRMLLSKRFPSPRKLLLRQPVSFFPLILDIF